MKKAIAIILILIMTLSLCACGIFIASQTPEQKLEDQKNLLNDAQSIDELEAIINALQEIDDIEGKQELLDGATKKLDKAYLERINVELVVAKDGVTAQEFAKKISNKEISEKICVWINFQWYMQDIHKTVVSNFKQSLKDPNSFKDIGSTYTYDLEPAEEAGKLIVKNYTLTLKYTATNSFGGTVQDSCKFSPTDLTWKHGCEVLTIEQIREVLSFSTFDKLYKTIEIT